MTDETNPITADEVRRFLEFKMIRVEVATDDNIARLSDKVRIVDLMKGGLVWSLSGPPRMFTSAVMYVRPDGATAGQAALRGEGTIWVRGEVVRTSDGEFELRPDTQDGPPRSLVTGQVHP